MVLCMYKNDVYDALGDVEIVAKQVNKEQIKEIGKIILAYGCEEDVCVVVAHRHFNLARNEVILENSEEEKRIAKHVEMETIESLGAIPMVSRINQDNVLKVCNDESFLGKVGQYLVGNGLQNMFMLAARCSQEEKAQGVYFIEYNFLETRTSETRLCAMSEFAKGLETTYAFARNSDGQAEEFCSVVCRSIGFAHIQVHFGN